MSAYAVAWVIPAMSGKPTLQVFLAGDGLTIHRGKDGFFIPATQLRDFYETIRSAVVSQEAANWHADDNADPYDGISAFEENLK